MESYLRFSIIVLVLGLCAIGFAEQPAGSVSASANVGAGDAGLPQMPFMAEIISNDVYVRSGPGTNYYYSGKLNKNDKVKVVGTKFNWWQIVPPDGSYCWISKQYVEAQGTTGKVIGDEVRVYAGSDDVQPMHSTTMLVKLNNGDKVTLLGEEREGYYKIAAPEGAYLWVSNQFIKPLGSLVTPIPALPATPPSAPAPFPTPKAVQPNEPPPGTNPAPIPMPSNSQQIDEVKQLKEQVEAEKAKPIDQQNFSELKKAIEIIANNNELPLAAKNAQSLLKTVERYQIAQAVIRAEKLQEQQFEQIQQNIETAHAEQIANLEDLSVFAVIGQLKESPLFAQTPGAKYYRLLGADGKTLCFARPADSASDMDFSQFVDKKVGLIGIIEPTPELGNAVVQFTKIVELK